MTRPLDEPSSLSGLEERGFIARVPNRARAIEVIRGSVHDDRRPDPAIVELIEAAVGQAVRSRHA